MSNNKKMSYWGVGPVYVTLSLVITIIGWIIGGKSILQEGVNNKIKFFMYFLGVALILYGVYLWISGVVLSKIDKNIDENNLVTTGIYAYVRNPIYTSFAMIFSGIIMFRDNLFLLIIPFILWGLMSIIVRKEEKVLEDTFKEEYLVYKNRVNRCIPWMTNNENKVRIKDYKELSRIEFNKEAHKFDKDNPMDIYNMCKHDYQYILKKLDEEPFESLLDVGCGTGNVISLLSEKYPERSYTGIDLSEEMIKVARNKKISQAYFINGDSENLPFEKEKFDVVICTESFHHYPNPEIFFDEVYRVLKSGGRFIILDITAWKLIQWIENRIILLHLKTGDKHVYGIEEMRRLYQKHGFCLEDAQKAGIMRFICCGRR